MEYLIRFVQAHETFRKPEIESLAELIGIGVQWISYDDDSPFAIIRLNGETASNDIARRLVSRSILATSIHELWGQGTDYETLHFDVRQRSQHIWPTLNNQSFRFDIDAFQGTRRTAEARRQIFDSFSYTKLTGPIVMSNPQNQFTVFEDYTLHTAIPKKVFLGRLVAESGRRAITTYTLKKRRYIATTSMDAELSLVTANLALAAPGKLAYDPFMGTGSFPLSCAHFGAVVLGSDMDGRTVRGKNGINVASNFAQYGTSAAYLGGFAADITNSPVRRIRGLDAIVCDPPYGVREGLKVLGSHRVALNEVVLLADGTPAHLQEGYVPPRKPYSFVRMLDDILDFSAETLVDHGRLCMWMPVAGGSEDDGLVADVAESKGECEGDSVQAELAVPSHPALELLSLCTQDFNKWSRRLLTYRRRPQVTINAAEEAAYKISRTQNGLASDAGVTADDLNDFRKQYFQGFRTASKP